MPSVTVKWGKEKYPVDVDVGEPPIVFKSQLFALTGVAPERQKVMIKGKTLTDDSWNGIAISDGLMIMMMGSADAIPEAPKAPTAEEVAVAAKKEIKLPNGLQNLGNTCYMNSVIQSFKAVPELESCLLKNYERTSSVASQMATSVKSTFEQINKPHGNAVMPLQMLTTLHAALPQFATRSNQGGGWEQQDANECFTEVLRLTLEGLGQAKPEGSDAPISNFFRGSYKVTMSNTENPDEPAQTSTENFTQLSCFLSQEVKYIQTGLREKMTETIEKASPTLGRNAKYEKKALISRLPAYVSVQMVRFFYKESSQTNAKILKDVKFPLILDLFEMAAPELQEKLRPQRDAFKADEDAKLERLRRKKLTDKQDQKEDEEDDGVPLPFSFEDDPGSNNSGFYELKAVITHKGRASNSGHYVAWVRVKGDKWAMCDDDEVHPVTADQVLKLSGGGDWHTAYVLLYGPRICHKYPALKDAEATATGVEEHAAEPMQS